MNLKKILVPVDFSDTSETATSNAIVLAKLLKADVYLIHVIENNWFSYSELLDEQIIMPSLLDFEKVIEKKMYELQEKIYKTFNIKPDIYFTNGQIHKEIIKFSKKNKIDLIIMGTHGKSGYDEFFLGSNAQRVVTLSNVPVLTMQKKCKKPRYKNILIPIDNSLHSREKVNIAVLFANLFKAKVHIVGLVKSEDKQELDKFNIKIDSIKEVLNSNKLQNVTKIVHNDNLAKTALDYASENKCDLIIINSGHESKLNNVILRSFAQQIVNHSTIPVLSVKKSTKSEYSISAAGFPGS